MEFVGLLKQRLDFQKGSGSHGDWKIATYLLETIESFPKHMVVKVFDGLNGRLAKFDALMGKNVTVYFDCDAREYNGRYYNEIVAGGIKSNEPEEPKE